jgi:anti-sigma regulatory factor (Ser/Thr protein kinase)
MRMSYYRITIPNILNWSHREAEDLVTLVASNLGHAPLVYDMSEVDFLNPYGVLLLLATARHVVETTGHHVRLKNLRVKVHAYLDRVDLFEECDAWLNTNDILADADHYSRSDASSNVLEITCLASIRAQVKFQSRARHILHTWLCDDAREIDDVITVLSEICNNALEHSEDKGHAMIQRYVRQDHVEVHIVVADLGIGIAKSLSRRHGKIAKTSEDYIQLALKGYSARGRRKGGAGFRIIQDRISRRGGTLAIRSEAGLVVTNEKGVMTVQQGNFLPGTQVSVKLRSKVGI